MVPVNPAEELVSSQAVCLLSWWQLSCAGLVAGTLGNGYLSRSTLLSELGTLRMHDSWRNSLFSPTPPQFLQGGTDPQSRSHETPLPWSTPWPLRDPTCGLPTTVVCCELHREWAICLCGFAYAAEGNMISNSPSCSPLISSVFSLSAGVGKAVTVTLTPCHCSRKAVCGVSSCLPQSGGGSGDHAAPHSPPGLGAGCCLLHGSSWRSPPRKSLGLHSGKPPSPSGFLPCVPASQNAPVGSSGAS